MREATIGFLIRFVEAMVRIFFFKRKKRQETDVPPPEEK